MDIEQKLVEMNVKLPTSIAPMANYATCVRTGNLLYTSGASCFKDGKPVYQGKLGKELSIEQGYEASRLTALNILSTLKHELGSLNKIKRFIKILGFVNSTDDFIGQPEVINGASDLFVEVLGEKGIHTRSAIGTNVLPLNIPVEIEVIVEIKED